MYYQANATRKVPMYSTRYNFDFVPANFTTCPKCRPNQQLITVGIVARNPSGSYIYAPHQLGASARGHDPGEHEEHIANR